MKSQNGFTLVEVMIAILLIGIIGIPFLGAIATAYRTTFTGDERATAESLARTQMEYVKNQAYIMAPDGGEVIYQKIGDIPTGYEILSFSRSSNEVTNIVGVPWDSQNDQPELTDAGRQRIKLLIKHLDKELFTLEDYKAKR